MSCSKNYLWLRPKLEDAYQVWSSNIKKHKELLEKGQRRVTKMIPKIRTEVQGEIRGYKGAHHGKVVIAGN